MSKILIGIVVAIVAAIFLFFNIIISTAFGALTGYVLSLIFLGDWIIQGFQIFGIDASGQLVVIGALFGFMSGFFKSSTTVNKE